MRSQCFAGTPEDRDEGRTGEQLATELSLGPATSGRWPVLTGLDQADLTVTDAHQVVWGELARVACQRRAAPLGATP